MDEVTIRMPAATPEAYLAYVEWWRALRRFLQDDPRLLEESRAAGGSIDTVAVLELAATHSSQIESQARQALEAGKGRVAPLLSGRPVPWRIALVNAERRREWLRELARTRDDIPALSPQAETARAGVHRMAARALDAMRIQLTVIPLETPGRFRLRGEIDMSNAEDVLQVLTSELRSGPSIRLDLAELSFMDVDGVRALIRLGRTAQSVGRAPVVIDPSPEVREILALALPAGTPGVEIRDGESGG